jgi:hypothetical protein
MGIGEGSSGGGPSQGGASPVRAVAYTAADVVRLAETDYLLEMDSWRTDLGQTWQFGGGGEVILPEDGLYVATWYQFFSNMVIPAGGTQMYMVINGSIEVDTYPVLDQFFISDINAPNSVEHAVTSPIFRAMADQPIYAQVSFDSATDVKIEGGGTFQKLYVQKVGN